MEFPVVNCGIARPGFEAPVGDDVARDIVAVSDAEMRGRVTGHFASTVVIGSTHAGICVDRAGHGAVLVRIIPGLVFASLEFAAIHRADIAFGVIAVAAVVSDGFAFAIGAETVAARVAAVAGCLRIRRCDYVFASAV